MHETYRALSISLVSIALLSRLVFVKNRENSQKTRDSCVANWPALELW